MRSTPNFSRKTLEIVLGFRYRPTSLGGRSVTPVSAPGERQFVNELPPVSYSNCRYTLVNDRLARRRLIGILSTGTRPRVGKTQLCSELIIMKAHITEHSTCQP